MHHTTPHICFTLFVEQSEVVYLDVLIIGIISELNDTGLMLANKIVHLLTFDIVQLQ